MTDISQLNQTLQRAAAARDSQANDEAVRLYTELINQTAGQTDDPAVREIRLTALRENGRLHRLLGDQLAALRCLQQYYLDAGRGEQAVDGLTLLANQHNSMGNYDEALQAGREALELTEALNYSTGRAAAFQSLGRAYAHQGRTEEAITNMQKRWRFSSKLAIVPKPPAPITGSAWFTWNAGRLIGRSTPSAVPYRKSPTSATCCAALF